MFDPFSQDRAGLLLELVAAERPPLVQPPGIDQRRGERVFAELDPQHEGAGLLPPAIGPIARRRRHDNRGGSPGLSGIRCSALPIAMISRRWRS